MSRKTTDTTLSNSFLRRIKKLGCSFVKTIAEEMNLLKATLYSRIASGMKTDIKSSIPAIEKKCVKK